MIHGVVQGSGEEEEEQLLQLRVRLFALERGSGAWQERGLCQLRLNVRHNDSSRSRIIARLLPAYRYGSSLRLQRSIPVFVITSCSYVLSVAHNDKAAVACVVLTCGLQVGAERGDMERPARSAAGAAGRLHGPGSHDQHATDLPRAHDPPRRGRRAAPPHREVPSARASSPWFISQAKGRSARDGESSKNGREGCRRRR